MTAGESLVTLLESETEDISTLHAVLVGRAKAIGNSCRRT